MCISCYFSTCFICCMFTGNYKNIEGLLILLSIQILSCSAVIAVLITSSLIMKRVDSHQLFSLPTNHSLVFVPFLLHTTSLHFLRILIDESSATPSLFFNTSPHSPLPPTFPSLSSLLFLKLHIFLL